MSKFAWCTDIHLDHIRSDAEIVDFAKRLVETDPPAVLITGDISVAPRLVYHLSILESAFNRPTYFVLGNHDYFNGGIDEVRKSMRELTNMSQFLKYLPLTSFTALSPSTALVGHDGWYDGGYGDAQNSQFMMNDWSMIQDFVQHSGGHRFMVQNNNLRDRASLISVCQRLAREGVMHVMTGIKHASRYHKNIIVLTHFPPFRESHIYRGQVGDDHAQPWFTSKMMGDMLLDAARTYKNINFTVLAGHTHGAYDGNPAPNMRVIVGHSDYGHPALAGMIEVS